MVIILIVLIFLTLVVIIPAYWIPKKLGYPKVGKYLSITITLVIAVVTTLMIFEDDFFTKSDAQKLLAEQKFEIKDEFELKENKSMYAPGDYYHTFTLIISSSDKQRIINEIKNSSNFFIANQNEISNENQSDYFNESKRIKNYETDTKFVREFFEPQRQRYVRTWRIIGIRLRRNIQVELVLYFKRLVR